MGEGLKRAQAAADLSRLKQVIVNVCQPCLAGKKCNSDLCARPRLGEGMKYEYASAVVVSELESREAYRDIATAAALREATTHKEVDEILVEGYGMRTEDAFDDLEIDPYGDQ